MAFFQEQGFWKHHLAASASAIVIITIARSVGIAGDPHALAALFLQSSILVAIALPIQTACALLGVRHLAASRGLRNASLAGCVLAALPASAASTVAIWYAGFATMPSHVSPASQAIDLGQWIVASYVPIALLHATLGSLMWMRLGFPWWRRHFESSAAPIPAPVPLVAAPPAAPAPAASPGQAPAQPSFMRRLKPQNLGELLALSAERHYVHVYTAAGDELLLMRLSDAIEECRHLDGMQIHRSCWVRRDAVEQLRRTNGRLEVRLRNGISLPVSRSRQSAAGAFFRNGRPIH